MGELLQSAKNSGLIEAHNMELEQSSSDDQARLLLPSPQKPDSEPQIEIEMVRQHPNIPLPVQKRLDIEEIRIDVPEEKIADQAVVDAHVSEHVDDKKQLNTTNTRDNSQRTADCALCGQHAEGRHDTFDSEGNGGFFYCNACWVNSGAI